VEVLSYFLLLILLEGIMEYLRVLCCGDKDDTINTISAIIDEWQEHLKIKILKREGKCLADYTMDEIDEEDDSYFEPFEINMNISYKNKGCRVSIRRITMSDKRYMQMEVQYQQEDDIKDLDTSIWYEMKKELIEWMDEKYDKIFWLADSQNNKIATNLYTELHKLENYLREIINSYMCIKHGGNWFEAYSYEDYKNKYSKFSEWFNKSRYDLFKSVDNHLFNLEIDDIFESLKAAKRKPVSKIVRKALENIKKDSKENAAEIAKVELLESISLWDEENFDEVFDKQTVGRWKSDLSKRRNMVAHNKMICKDMYKDTMQSINLFEEKFQEANRKLSHKLKSQEQRELESLFHQNEIDMYLEDCGISSTLPDEQDIIDNINQTDDFIELSGIINDRVACIGGTIEELLSMLDDVNMMLNEGNFFEDDVFTGRELLEQYIEFCCDNPLYSSWKTLIKTDMPVEIYRLIEPQIAEDISKLIEQLSGIKQNIFFVDLDCYSEGDLIRIIDFSGNRYALTINGWFCPDRGCLDEITVELTCNEELIEYGGIDVSYGDYELTEDGTPLPSTEDDIFVRIDKVNKELNLVIDSLFSDLANIESEIMKIEI